MELNLSSFPFETSVLWSSPLYKNYEDLRRELSDRSLSSGFSRDYCKNMKEIYGGRVFSFEELNSFVDVYGNIKLGIEHCCYIDINDRVYDPFLGYYDIDVSSYLKYVSAESLGLSNIVSYKIF